MAPQKSPFAVFSFNDSAIILAKVVFIVRITKDCTLFVVGFAGVSGEGKGVCKAK
jgi:hypothetical protein